MNKNNTKTFLPDVVKPSANKYNKTLMKETIRTPAPNYLKVEIRNNL